MNSRKFMQFRSTNSRKIARSFPCSYVGYRANWQNCNRPGGDRGSVCRKTAGAHITPTQYHGARIDLTADARDEYVLDTISRAVVDKAIELTAHHRLRGYDAVHLACALTLERALVARQLSPLVFVSAPVEMPAESLMGPMGLLPPIGGDALADTEALYDQV